MLLLSICDDVTLVVGVVPCMVARCGSQHLENIMQVISVLRRDFVSASGGGLCQYLRLRFCYEIPGWYREVVLVTYLAQLGDQ